MKFRSLILAALCLLMAGFGFTSCSDDDEEEEITSGVFILNEGSFQGNNAGITVYNPETGAITGDIYYAQNDKKLGDTGQDMIEYKNRVYVTVYGSNRLVKLDNSGKELKSLSFTAQSGFPRYMAAENGKLYVTLWSNEVVRIDTTDLTIEASVAVGRSPEQIVEEDGKLYVANSGGADYPNSDKTVSVIDLSTFSLEKTITVVENPNNILEAAGDIYVLSWGNYADIPYTLQRLNVAAGTYEEIVTATLMAENNGVIYLVNSVTDWNTQPAVTTNTFFSYDARTRKLNENSFLTLTGEAEPLTTASVHMLEIDAHTGDIYVGTSDYTHTGDIYRFSRKGTLIKKFNSGGISPNNAVFFK